MVILYPFYTWGNRGLETYHFYSIGNNERTENEHTSVSLQNLSFNHNADPSLLGLSVHLCELSMISFTVLPY